MPQLVFLCHYMSTVYALIRARVGFINVIEIEMIRWNNIATRTYPKSKLHNANSRSIEISKLLEGVSLRRQPKYKFWLRFYHFLDLYL